MSCLQFKCSFLLVKPMSLFNPYHGANSKSDLWNTTSDGLKKLNDTSWWIAELVYYPAEVKHYMLPKGTGRLDETEWVKVIDPRMGWPVLSFLESLTWEQAGSMACSVASALDMPCEYLKDRIAFIVRGHIMESFTNIHGASVFMHYDQHGLGWNVLYNYQVIALLYARPAVDWMPKFEGVFVGNGEFCYNWIVDNDVWIAAQQIEKLTSWSTRPWLLFPDKGKINELWCKNAVLRGVEVKSGDIALEWFNGQVEELLSERMNFKNFDIVHAFLMEIDKATDNTMVLAFKMFFHRSGLLRAWMHQRFVEINASTNSFSRRTSEEIHNSLRDLIRDYNLELQ